MSCLVDTTCVVAVCSSAHEHHEATIAELERRLARGEELVLASHTVAEAYAVLTRLPPPHRVAPAQAVEVLEAGWGSLRAVHLSAAETWAVIRAAPSRGVAGGRTSDALIAACARKAKVATLLTWNAGHFESLADGFIVVRPRG